jgi:hypothetical protein
MKITYCEEHWFWLHRPFSHKVSIHFYGLAQQGTSSCTYALSRVRSEILSAPFGALRLTRWHYPSNSVMAFKVHKFVCCIAVILKHVFLMDSSAAELIWNAFGVLSAPWFSRRGWYTLFSASHPQQSFLYSHRKQWPCRLQMTENFLITLLFLFRELPLISLMDLRASLDRHSILISFVE